MVVKTRMYACTFALCNVQSSRQPTEQDRCCIRFKVALDSKSDTTTTTKITTQRHYISHYAYGYPLLSHYNIMENPTIDQSRIDNFSFIMLSDEPANLLPRVQQFRRKAGSGQGICASPTATQY